MVVFNCCELNIREKDGRICNGGGKLRIKVCDSCNYKRIIYIPFCCCSVRRMEINMAVINYGNFFTRSLTPCSLANAGRGGMLEWLSIYSGDSHICIRIYAEWQ